MMKIPNRITADDCFCSNGHLCPKKDRCQRWVVKGWEFVSQSAFYEPGKECDQFWDMDEEIDTKDLPEKEREELECWIAAMRCMNQLDKERNNGR